MRFQLLDADGSGQIDAKELREGMREEGRRPPLTVARRELRAADADGDGAVSLKEYLDHWDFV